mmetsp:Transcript_19007/g.28986  ORF Transcript_19007/g.28986 Transcript_19007/m.28986 type:complete len:83 (+) Transcript_19007:1121-1369(+)
MSSSARSKDISENIENFAGAAEAPNGSLVSIVPTSVSDFFIRFPSESMVWVCHVEQHFAEISGVVWRRLKALSMSTLLHKIR